MWWGADQNSSSQCLSPQLYLPRCHISAATNGCHPGRHQHCMFFQPGEVYRSLAPGPLTAGKVCCPDGSSTSRQCLKQHIWSAAGPEVLLHDVLKDRSCSGSPLHCPLSWQVHSPSSKMREETKRQRSEELASSAPPLPRDCHTCGHGHLGWENVPSTATSSLKERAGILHFSSKEPCTRAKSYH